MKLLKKAAGMILAVCLMVPMLGTVVFASDGVLMFSDPSTKVGENVEVDMVVQSSTGGAIQSVDVTMSYDTSSLEFIGGDGFTADGNGTLTYTGKGNGSELRATMEFRALLAGNTGISVTESKASLATGDTLSLQQGASAVTIAAADDGSTSAEPSGGSAVSGAGETTDIVVSVDGTDYNFSEAFTKTDIPEGYSETMLTFNGSERKFAENEAGVTLGFLVDASGKGGFFLYNAENATFLPFAQLTISDTTSIIPLDKADAVTLPENYQQSKLTVQENEFPVWSDPSSSDRYYIIYALNTRTNQEGLYQYDEEDGTYQYFEAPEQEEEETSTSALPGKLGGFISEHILTVLIAAAVIFLFLLILLIIFAVKLVHRNQELDDLYDEYDIPIDDDDDSESSGLDDDVDDYEDDDYEDDYEDDDYEDEEYEEYEDDYEESGDSLRGKKKGNSSKDDYDIDFVDL